MKQYFTGFFTAICLTTSVFLFMVSQNRNHGAIEVSSITIKDKYSASAIAISSDGMMMINNKGKKLVSIGQGDALGGAIRTFSEDGREMAFFGANKDGDGGILRTKNIFGEETGYFGTDIKNNGIVTLSDRYGNIGWVANGKQ